VVCQEGRQQGVESPLSGPRGLRRPRGSLGRHLLIRHLAHRRWRSPWAERDSQRTTGNRHRTLERSVLRPIHAGTREDGDAGEVHGSPSPSFQSRSDSDSLQSLEMAILLASRPTHRPGTAQDPSPPHRLASAIRQTADCSYERPLQSFPPLRHRADRRYLNP
jgi:hypothetical protein